MAFRLIPKEESFFDLFEKASDNLFEAAKLLAETMADFDKLQDNALRMERIEHGGDQIVHEISARLNQTFITPLDREDIHHLASALDDVLDLIEQTTERFVLFKVKQVTPFAKELAQVVQRQVEQIHMIMPELRDPRNKDIITHCIEINRLENAGDRVLRNALEELFANHTDAIEVIKWRELYEILEGATDKCEDVAVIIEGILVKNG